MKQEQDFNTTVVEYLKGEEQKLRQAMDNCLKRNQLAMYKNLIQAYERIVYLIKKYDWQIMHSEYGRIEDGITIPTLSIWEQNGDGQTRNHNVYTLANSDKVNTVINNITISSSLDPSETEDAVKQQLTNLNK